MVVDYLEYINLTEDYKRELEETKFFAQHGMCLPVERFSKLTAAACFYPLLYEYLLEGISWYIDAEQYSPQEPSSEEISQEIANEQDDIYDIEMAQEMAWYNHARMMGWE